MHSFCLCPSISALYLGLKYVFLQTFGKVQVVYFVLISLTSHAIQIRSTDNLHNILISSFAGAENSIASKFQGRTLTKSPW